MFSLLRSAYPPQSNASPQVQPKNSTPAPFEVLRSEHRGLGLEQEIIDVETPRVLHKSSFMSLKNFKSRNRKDANHDQLYSSKPQDPSTQPRASSATTRSHVSKSSTSSRPEAGFTNVEFAQLAKSPASSLGLSLGLAYEGVVQHPSLGRDDQGAQTTPGDAEVLKSSSATVFQVQNLKKPSSPPLKSQLSQIAPQAPTDNPCHPVTRHRRFATCEVLEIDPRGQLTAGESVSETTSSTDPPFYSALAPKHPLESSQPAKSSSLEQFRHSLENSVVSAFSPDQIRLDHELLNKKPTIVGAAISVSDHTRGPTNLPVRLESKDDLVDMLERLVGRDMLRSVVDIRKINGSARYSISDATVSAPVIQEPPDSQPSKKLLHSLDPPTPNQPKNQSLFTRLRSKATNLKSQKTEPTAARAKEPLVNLPPRVASLKRQPLKLPSVDTRGSCRVSFGGQKHYLPVVAVRTVEEIGKRGMQTRGLLERKGDLHRVQQLSEIYGTSISSYGYEHDLAQEDVHTICSVLIGFLKALPEPLLDNDLYKLIWVFCVADLDLKAASEPRTSDSPHPTSRKVHIAQCVLRLMPPRQFSLLICLFSFMAKTLNFPENGLTPLAIAGIFGPTLLCPRGISAESDISASAGTSNASRPGAPSKLRSKAVHVIVWMLENWKAIYNGLLVEHFELKQPSAPVICASTDSAVGVIHLNVKHEDKSGLGACPVRRPMVFPLQGSQNQFRRRRSTFDSSQFQPWSALQVCKRQPAGTSTHTKTELHGRLSTSPLCQALPPLSTSLSPDATTIRRPMPNENTTVTAELIMPPSVCGNTAETLPVRSHLRCPQPSPLTEGRRLNRSRSSHVLSTRVVQQMKPVQFPVICPQPSALTLTEGCRLNRSQSSRVQSTQAIDQNTHPKSTSIELNQLLLPKIAKPTLKTMRQILAEKDESMPSKDDRPMDFDVDLASPTSDAHSVQTELADDDLSHNSLRASAAFVFATWLSVEVNQGNADQGAQTQLAMGDAIPEEDMDDEEEADIKDAIDAFVPTATSDAFICDEPVRCNF